MSVRKNLAADQGTTFNLSLRVNDETGPVDLTGATATFYINDMGTEPALYTKTVAGDATGYLTFAITDEETTLWEAADRAYRVDLDKANGDKSRLIYGLLRIRSGING